MDDKLKERKEKLFSQNKSGYSFLDAQEEANMNEYCKKYKDYLEKGRTERLCVDRTVELAIENGFKEYHRGDKLKENDKIYYVNRKKSVILAIIGQKSLKEGAQIAAAHIDSPRLDLKPNPLYEDSELAYFKTHYYGGIRKYQWVTIPLEMHGIVYLKNGENVSISLGHNEEPKFVITDLLPHLGQEQGKKPLAEAIPAETLNILIGSRPIEGDDKELVKLSILEILFEKYGITEDDFMSAELEIVPSLPTTDIGLDASMIGAYGHDDRVCSFAALQAILDLNETQKTAVCVLADKEEIGSMGVTGMQSACFDTFMEDICESQNVRVRECYENSFCLSADVTAAFDPNYADVFEKKNAAYLNHGVGLCKYTGARGKSGASDASAEVIAYIRTLLDQEKISWQIAELGKTDVGGGGTVAQYMANRNIPTLDAGVPVLSMHSPFEIVGKLDCYMTYRCCKAVYKSI